ncbi:Transducin/WD40 repeat-like superfamily protein, partial [Perilla frutescens var. hirtella]
MGRFTQCPSDEAQDSEQLYSSSLASQPSLPSVPSLTPPFDLPTTTHHHCLATLQGHSSYIFSLALAGKHLYCGSSNGEVRVWDRNPSSYSEISHNHTVSDSQSAVKSIIILGDKMFTAHNDHKIRVWKIDNNNNNNKKYTTITVLPTMSDRCMSLFSAKNYVQVRRHKRCTWVHHVDAVSALASTRDGSLIYSVSWDRSFKIWRTSDFKCLESVQNAHDDAINAVVLSDDGLVYTGSADKRIKVWRMNGGEESKHSLVSTLEKHRSAVNALALSSDGSILYSGACDRSIIVWEREGGGGHMAVAGALRGHTKAILCLGVVGELLCSGSADRSVRVWRRGSGNSYSCLAVLEGHTNPVKCLTAAPGDSHNSYLLYTGSLDFQIK